MNSIPQLAERTYLAPTPFDGRSKPEYDIVLKTADNILYRVHKLILSLSSPVFQDMFSLPTQAKDETADGRPIIVVSERSHVLNLVLRFCYPSCDTPSTLPDMDWLNVLEVMSKYQMDAQERTVHNILLSADPTKLHPLTLYSISYSLRWKEGAQQALKALLHTYSDQWPDTETLEFIPARMYHRILKYYQQCCTAASASIDIPGIIARTGRNWECQSCSESTPFYLPRQSAPVHAAKWFTRYLQASASTLLKCPSGDKVTSPEFVTSFMELAAECNDCRNRRGVYSQDGMASLKQIVRANIASGMEKVRFELEF